MDPIAIVQHLGGVATTGQLRAGGASSRAIAACVDSGALVRVRKGCLAAPGADAATVAAVAYRGAVTCVSLARRLGLVVDGADARCHLAIDARRNLSGDHTRPPRSVHVHRVHDVAAAGTAAGAVDLASRCLDRDAQLVLLDSALGARLLRSSEIAGFTVTPRRRRAFLERLASPATQSPLETRVRLALHRARLPFEEQAAIDGVGRVDFLVAGRVIVEADGRAFHDHAAQFREDRRRDRAAAALGLAVLRFTHAEVRDPERLVGEIRAVLAAPPRW